MQEPVNYHFFLHIPKTAGTSIRELLDARFHADRCIPTIKDMREKWGGVYPTIPQLLSLPDSVWHSAQLMRGHYYYQVASRFPRAPICLTMLREPISRSVSTIRHILRQAPMHRGKSVRDLIFDDDFMLCNVANMQTKLLGVRFDLSNPDCWPKNVNGKVKLAEEHLTLATETLQKFHFVGLQERFEESVLQLFDLFGWPMQTRLPQSNVGQDEYRSELDAECMAQIRLYNQLDRQLYEFACNLFKQRYSAFKATRS